MTSGINVVSMDDSKSVSSKSTECQLLDLDYDSKGSQVRTDNNNRDETNKYTGLLGTVMNLTVSIIGGAIYALPYSAAQVGWSIAIGLMVFGAVLTWFGIHLLGNIANKIGNRQTTFGLALEMSYPWLTIIVDLVVVFLGWCVAVVYLTVASTVMPDVMADFMDVETQSPNTPIYVEAWFWLAIFWVGLALPLSMTRTLFFVAPAALAAVICVGYTAFISFGYLVGIFDPCVGVSASCQGEVDVAVWNFQSIMRAFPVFIQAYCMGPIVFTVYNSMGKNSVSRVDAAGFISLLLGSCFYTVIMLCSYLVYGSEVKANVLDSFPRSLEASIARMGTAFVVTVSYPIIIHTSRDHLIHILSKLIPSKCISRDVLDYATRIGKITFYSTTLALNLLAVLFAYFQIDINFMLSLAGAFGTIHLSLTVPAAVYWKLFEDEGLSVQRLLTIPFGFVGIFIMCISVWTIFF